jgi:hypothetical protein
LAIGNVESLFLCNRVVNVGDGPNTTPSVEEAASGPAVGGAGGRYSTIIA